MKGSDSEFIQTMVSKNNKTLRSIILLQVRNPTWYLKLVYSNVFWLIPQRGLESVLTRTEEVSFICE